MLLYIADWFLGDSQASQPWRTIPPGLSKAAFFCFLRCRPAGCTWLRWYKCQMSEGWSKPDKIVGLTRLTRLTKSRLSSCKKQFSVTESFMMFLCKWMARKTLGFYHITSSYDAPNLWPCVLLVLLPWHSQTLQTAEQRSELNLSSDTTAHSSMIVPCWEFSLHTPTKMPPQMQVMFHSTEITCNICMLRRVAVGNRAMRRMSACPMSISTRWQRNLRVSTKPKHFFGFERGTKKTAQTYKQTETKIDFACLNVFANLWRIQTSAEWLTPELLCALKPQSCTDWNPNFMTSSRFAPNN
jgi:hypothetical protein